MRRFVQAFGFQCPPPPVNKVRVQRSGIDTTKYHTWPRIPKGKWQLTIGHHKREPRGQPFPSRWPQGTHKGIANTRQKKDHCGAVAIEKDKYMTPAHSLKTTGSSHSTQYRRHQTYSDALKNSPTRNYFTLEKYVSFCGQFPVHRGVHGQKIGQKSFLSKFQN